MDSLRIMQDGGATTDAIRVTPANNHGISVNTFSSFSVTGKKLTLIHGGIQDEGYAPAKLIVIKSDSISIQHEIELLGEPADILFVDTSSAGSNKISCVSCKFTNFGRVTLAAATTGSTISGGMSAIGKLSTFSGGIIEVTDLDAVGIQSLELIAESVTTTGKINTNMRANIDSNGGYTLSPTGKYTVASGGINIYAGTTAVAYEGLSVSARSGTHAGSLLELDGQYSAATVSIISTRPVRIKNTAKLTTFSDIVATSVHQGNLIVPVEGVFIQTSRTGYSAITVDGQIQSDNKVQLVSPDGITLNKKLQGGETFLVSGGGVRLTNHGSIESGVLTVGSNWFSNQGYISANTVEVETSKTLYNHFGGQIKGNSVRLVSLEGSVVNGSRTNKEFRPSDLGGLALSSQLTANDQYGIYSQVKNESGTTRSNLGALIAGNSVDIKAMRFENINPYHLTKPTSDIWSNGIDLDVSASRRVLVQAEQSLRITAAQYVLNSSAVMGLNQVGNVDINTPLLMNQRYRIEAELAIFSRQTYREDGVDGYSSGDGTSGLGIETYLTAYSPPAVLYSFGDFRFSDGLENNSSRAEFVNQFSFLEVSADAHFHDTNFQSIGLMMAGRPSHGYEPVRCAAYGCSAQTYTSLIEYETLSSFAGTVYGISSNLKVTTVNQLDDQSKQMVLDTFIADYKARVSYEQVTYNPTGAGVHYVKNKHYVSKVEISSRNGGDYLYLTVQKCMIYMHWDSTLNQTCNATQESFNVNAILAADAETALVNGLEYTGEEIREKVASYISGQSYRGNFEIPGYSTVPGTYVRKYTLWTLTENQQQFVIDYKQTFEPDSTWNLSEGEGRTIGYYSTGGSITVDVEELMGSVVPAAPANFRVTSTNVSGGVGTVNLAWNSVPGSNIQYFIDSSNVGATLTRSITISTPGSITRKFYLRACNSVHCGPSVHVQVELVIPPTASQTASCTGLFYRPFSRRYTTTPTSSNEYGKFGNHCAMKTVDGVTYYVIAEQVKGFYAPGAEYTACRNIKLYNKESLIAAILAGNGANFPSSGGLASANQRCSDHLNVSFHKMNW